jgi:predicted transglutaminase-like cysteine proteinase
MRRRWGVAFVMVTAALLGGCAAWPGWFGEPAAANAVAAANAAADRAYPAVAPVPPGFIAFCVRRPDQCRRQPGDADTVVLTAERWNLLVNINASVNGTLWPEDDKKHYGRAEYWNIPADGFGDCEDFALKKRQLLIAAGFSEPALRLTIAETPSGQRHAVLDVVTDRGDFILDNLGSEILIRNAVPYRWIERQDPAHTLGWVALDRSAAAPDVAAAATGGQTASDIPGDGGAPPAEADHGRVRVIFWNSPPNRRCCLSK